VAIVALVGQQIGLLEMNRLNVTPRDFSRSMLGVGQAFALSPSSHFAESWSTMKKTILGRFDDGAMLYLLVFGFVAVGLVA
jgi:hypothetical protein